MLDKRWIQDRILTNKTRTVIVIKVLWPLEGIMMHSIKVYDIIYHSCPVANDTIAALS